MIVNVLWLFDGGIIDQYHDIFMTLNAIKRFVTINSVYAGVFRY
ncbi:hypothetical protein PAUR_b0831 [Pseudoalteromonas aurantia 208]|uniref:Uncharacterized protein n=1 Tax=Pseudoalteromonas aurantia 208 TaxID=1314867 RepID=A0ABR9EIG0_9GAMM|nr:hypothetical protein [Pseudoalteromonas aurantia 208]